MSHEKEESTTTTTPAKVTADTQAKDAMKDQVAEILRVNLIDPLTRQEELFKGFSRSGPTHSTTYELVENTAKSTDGLTSYQVMMKKKPLRKSAKETNTVFLDLRHVKKDDLVLVKLKDSWVKLDEHPVVKRLLKFKDTWKRMKPTEKKKSPPTQPETKPAPTPAIITTAKL